MATTLIYTFSSGDITLILGVEHCFPFAGDKVDSLDDLASLSPRVAQSLRQLLEYDGPEPVEDVFGLTFSISEEAFGEVRVVPLREGGEEQGRKGSHGRIVLKPHLQRSLS